MYCWLFVVRNCKGAKTCTMKAIESKKKKKNRAYKKNVRAYTLTRLFLVVAVRKLCLLSHPIKHRTKISRNCNNYYFGFISINQSINLSSIFGCIYRENVDV